MKTFSKFYFLLLLGVLDGSLRFSSAFETLGGALDVPVLRSKRDGVLHSIRKRNLRVAGSFPSHNIKFEALGHNFDIELTDIMDHDLFADDFRAVSIGDDGEIEHMEVERNCILGGFVKGNDAASSNRKNRATISFCHGSVVGTINAFGEEFFVNPRSAVSSESGDDIVISRKRDLEATQTVQTCANDDANGHTVDDHTSGDNDGSGETYTEVGISEDDPDPNDGSTDISDNGLPVKYVKLVLVSDFERYKLFGSKRDVILASMVSIASRIKEIYLDFPSSSGFSIRVQITALISYEKSNPWTSVPKSSFGEVSPSVLLSTFNTWRTSAIAQKVITSDSIAHLLSGEDFEGSIVGLAALSQACSRYYGSGVSQATSSIYQFVAKIVAHELGHNLGIRHTNVYVPGSAINAPAQASGCSATYNVMSAALASGAGAYTWDSCSSAWFKMFMQGYPYDCKGSDCSYTKGYGGASNPALCLDEKSPNAMLEGVMCGDGIQEGTEECDCGGSEEKCATIDPCCDFRTCKLKSESKCSAMDPCCNSATCSFFPASAKKVCRESQGECDSAETCSGSSSLCPADLFKPFGASCKVNLQRDSEVLAGTKRSGVCYRGACQSHEEQCMSLKDRGFYSDIDGECSRAGDDDGDQACGKLYCKRVGTDYCGTNYYSPDLTNVNEGTPCGVESSCFNGKCVKYGDQEQEEGSSSKPPTGKPTAKPTAPSATSRPSKRPTNRPSKKPTSPPTTKKPTGRPTIRPTKKPTERPSKRPTRRPSIRPTKKPTSRPSMRPTKKPGTPTAPVKKKG